MSAVTAYAIHSALALEVVGHDCIFTAKRGTPGAQAAIKAGLSSLPISDFNLVDRRWISRQLLKIKPDVIIVYGGKEAACLLGQKLPNGCLVLRFRGQDNDRYLGAWRSLIGDKFIDGTIFPSKVLQESWRSRLNRPSATVPFGSDIKQYFFDPMSFATRPPRTTLLMLGRLDPIKGHQWLFNIFFEIKKHWPAALPSPFLRVIGEEANLSRQDLIAFAQDVGLNYDQDWELVEGRVSHIHREYSAASTVVIPSLGSEVICRVGTEALLCGTPVLATNVGSLQELEDTQLGLMDVQSPDITKITEFLIRSSQEDSFERVRRSRASSMLYSLEAMGLNLMRFIDHCRN